MRLLIDIDDEHRGFVVESKECKGEVVMFCAPGRAIRASVVAEAVPHSVTGHGARGRAIYDITLLEDIEEA